MNRFAAYALLATVVVGTSSCGDSDPTDPDSLDVTGTWTGTLLLNIAGASIEGGEFSLHLSQSGGAVSGTQSDTEGDQGTVSGSLDGTTLTLVWLTNDTHPDCSLFNVTFVFTASSTVLDVTGASGRICSGSDGQKLVTGGDGRLTRQ